MLAIKIILLVMSIFLVVAVLLQEGKSQGLSALGGGGSESFLGKGKGKRKSEKLSTLTTIVAILFVVIVLLLGTFEQRNSDWYPDMNPDGTIEDPSFVSTTEPPATSPATKAPATTAPATEAPATTALSTVAPETK